MHIDTKAQRDAAAVKSVALRKVVWSSVLGSTVEWYDFTIYGTAAALVFNKLFFPNLSPAIGVIAAFGSYATGFLARPLGGAVFGHFGDRIGRKAMLSMTIILMGAGTFLIGCLPTYGQIGIAAPLLLVVLRIVQGIGIGGEWGGAVLMVIESAPNERRGFYGSLVQLGYPLAVILATAMFALVSQLPEREFLTWGWRVPFLLSAILVGIGLYIRLRLVETPAFRQVQEGHAVAKMPLLEILTKHPRTFLVSVGLKISEIAFVSIATVFSINYVTEQLGMARSAVLNGVLLAAVIELFTIPRVRLAIRPLRPQANVHCGLPLFDCICLSDVLALSNPQSCCDRNHDRRSGQFRTGHHVRTGSGLGRGTLPRSLTVQRRLTRLPTWRSPERRVDTHVGVGPPPVDRRDVVYLALPDRCCRCDHRCNPCGP